MATRLHERTLVNFYLTQHDLVFFQGHQKEKRGGQAWQVWLSIDEGMKAAPGSSINLNLLFVYYTTELCHWLI